MYAVYLLCIKSYFECDHTITLFKPASKVNIHAVLKCWSIDSHFVGEIQVLILTDMCFQYC